MYNRRYAIIKKGKYPYMLKWERINYQDALSEIKGVKGRDYMIPVYVNFVWRVGVPLCV